ncbi:MAG: ribosomal protein L7/L12 [Anaerolineales bacterium]|nr:ribosomal protein L7/L12 [Anaerolineales bacterium]
MDQIIVFILLLMFGLIVGILLGIWIWRKTSIQDVVVSRKTKFSDAGGSGEEVIPADILAQAEEFLAVGKKIEAIKLIRYHTDWNLRDAKTYVESMDVQSQVQSDLHGQSSSIFGKDISPGVMAEVRSLISERKIIDAVRLVRTHTGWGLKEAKDFIDSIR